MNAPNIWDWIAITVFSKNKIVKNMVYWLILTPILAKSFSKINNLNLELLGFDGSLILNLPFSWYMFFFSAFFFSIGNLCYALKCPEIIRDFDDFNDYSTKQKSMYYLVESFSSDLKRWTKFEANDMFFDLARRYVPFYKQTELTILKKRKVSNIITAFKSSNEDDLSNLFSGFKLILKDSHKYWRLLTTYSYILGLICIVVVAVQNLMFVLDLLVKNL